MSKSYLKYAPLYFAKMYKNSSDLSELINEIINPAISLLPKDENDDKAFLGNNRILNTKIKKNSDIFKVKLEEKGKDRKSVLYEVTELFHGAINWSSSLSFCNVNPESNWAGLQAYMLTAIFSPNMLEGEYAWNVHRAEIESGSMLANMVWDQDIAKNSGSLFSYGGEAGWQYALQYGLARVLKNTMSNGLFGNVPCKVICSSIAQFSKYHSSFWAGIGLNNLIQIPTDNTGAMRIDLLENELIKLQKNNIPVACIVCTEATTDENAYDPIKQVHDLIQKYPNPEGYGKPILFADAAIGFTWLMFEGYDFDKNEMQLSDYVKKLSKKMYDKISQMKYVDCFVADFHKSGCCPYISSIFVYKDRKEFEYFMRYKKESANNTQEEIKYPYLYGDKAEYNPMYYTLESSRAGTGTVAAWATLKYFGKEGFRILNIWEIEIHKMINDMISKQNHIIKVNKDNAGQVTLLRVYKESSEDISKILDKEINDKNFLPKLKQNNIFIEHVYQILYRWFQDKKKVDGKYTPFISLTRGYRNTTYNSYSELDSKYNPDAILYALKIYVMQFHANKETFKHVFKCIELAIKEAKDKYDNK